MALDRIRKQPEVESAPLAGEAYHDYIGRLYADDPETRIISDEIENWIAQPSPRFTLGECAEVRQ